MKVLWFTATPSLYDQGNHAYHGGGWIESLEDLITSSSDIDLGISFFHPKDGDKRLSDKTTYYPIKQRRARNRPVRSLFDNWRGALTDDIDLSVFKSIIEDFSPDLIQVFGTERVFGKIIDLTSVPVIIHIQGIINPYLNTYLPCSQSNSSFY